MKLYNAEDDRIEFRSDLAHPIFASGLAGRLVAVFPLSDSYRATYPEFSWGSQCGKPCLSWQVFSVVGQEPVDVDRHRTLKVWVVDVQRPQGSTLTYWVSKNPPYLLKAVAPFGQRQLE